MIAPMIHKMLRREDLLRLVDEIAITDPQEAYPAAQKLEAGRVDSLLDSPAALEAVRGRGERWQRESDMLISVSMNTARSE